MNCKECRQKMQQHVDGELFERKEEFEQHINECSNCADELERLLKTTAIYSNALKPSKDEQFTENLWAQIESQIAPLSRSVVYKPKKSIIEMLFYPLTAFVKRPAFVVPAVLVVLFLLTFKLFRPIEAPPISVVTKPGPISIAKISDYPAVEKVNKPNVTVLTMNTSDPHVKVVWFFDEKLKM